MKINSLKETIPFILLSMALIGCNKDVNNSGINTNQNSHCESDNKIFIEKNGFLKVAIEESDLKDFEWTHSQSVDGYEGTGYYVWTGDNQYNNPGNGLLTYKIRIETPGTYRFIWRSFITEGSDHTEHNDSWLRIADATHFYGKKNNGHIVYPKGTLLPPILESEGQESTIPNGGGRDGWFKVYMNTANEWKWQSSTSDHDAHNIFAVFEGPGEYTIEISGRSAYHGIDSFVLYQEELYTNSEATSEDLNASAVICN